MPKIRPDGQPAIIQDNMAYGAPLNTFTTQQERSLAFAQNAVTPIEHFSLTELDFSHAAEQRYPENFTAAPRNGLVRAQRCMYNATHRKRGRVVEGTSLEN